MTTISAAQSTRRVTSSHPTLIFWLIAGWLGFCLLPWYGSEEGLFSFQWLFDGYPFDTDYAPALFLILQGEKLWLAPLLPLLIAPIFALRSYKSDPVHAKILVITGALGFGWLIAQGFSIGIRGWNFGLLESLFGELGDRQFGMGGGAMLVASAFLFILTQGIAARGAVNGDIFVVGAIGFVIAIVTAFVFYPIFNMLCRSASIPYDFIYAKQLTQVDSNLSMGHLIIVYLFVICTPSTGFFDLLVFYFMKNVLMY